MLIYKGLSIFTKRCFSWSNIRSQSKLHFSIIGVRRSFLRRISFLIQIDLVVEVIYCLIDIIHEVFNWLEGEFLGNSFSFSVHRFLAPCGAAYLLLAVLQTPVWYALTALTFFIWMTLRLFKLICIWLHSVTFDKLFLLTFLRFDVTPCINPHKIVLKLLQIEVLNFDALFIVSQHLIID